MPFQELAEIHLTSWVHRVHQQPGSREVASWSLCGPLWTPVWMLHCFHLPSLPNWQGLRQRLPLSHPPARILGPLEVRTNQGRAMAWDCHLWHPCHSCHLYQRWAQPPQTQPLRTQVLHTSLRFPEFLSHLGTELSSPSASVARMLEGAAGGFGQTTSFKILTIKCLHWLNLRGLSSLRDIRLTESHHLIDFWLTPKNVTDFPRLIRAAPPQHRPWPLLCRLHLLVSGRSRPRGGPRQRLGAQSKGWHLRSCLGIDDGRCLGEVTLTETVRFSSSAKLSNTSNLRSTLEKSHWTDPCFYFQAHPVWNWWRLEPVASLHTAVLINWDIPVVLLLLGHSYRLTIDLLLLTLTIVRLQFPLILPPAPSLCTWPSRASAWARRELSSIVPCKWRTRL